MSNPRRRLVQGFLTALTALGATVLAPSDPASAASVTATVRTGGGPLRVRSDPTTASAQVGSVANGSRVTLVCSVNGQYVRGTVRGSISWDRLSTGGYVAHGYLSGGIVPPCGTGNARTPSSGGSSNGGATSAALVQGTVHTGGGPLRVRSGPSTLSTQSGSAGNGTALKISCQVSGESVSGPGGRSSQWDRLASGLYVAHSYVRSGAVPVCPTGSGGGGGGGTPAPPQAGTYAGTVKSSDGPVRIRAGASTSSLVVDKATNGSSLKISCSASGTYVKGSVSTTSQWDKLATGGYVSHAYVVSGSIPACSGGSSIVTPEPTGSMTNAQFIAASVAPAQRAYREYGVPASVTIAQAIIESGWGRSGLASNDHNYFGIKCVNGSPGPIASGCHAYSTRECTASKCALTAASFRVYGTVTDSFRDHSVFLTSGSRYKAAFAYSGNPDQFLYQIWRAGYATSPTYHADVTALMRRYNLYQYDLG